MPTKITKKRLAEQHDKLARLVVELQKMVGVLEKEGVDVNEWNQASKGKMQSLPKKVSRTSQLSRKRQR